MRCRGVHGVANPACLGGFLVSGLLGVAPYCVPVVSEWYQEAVDCWRMRKNYERLCIIAQPLV
jgi:hypothetical protein